MISIIITAYKEPATIGKAIEQILKNDLKNYEVLVTAPDEETLNAAKKYYKKIKNLKLIKDKGQGKPAALNLAVSKSKGDTLILTDGDVYVGENSLKPLLEHFEDKSVGAVSGHPLSLDSKKDMLGYWSCVLLDMANKLRIKRSKENKFLLCSGYLFAVRKEFAKKMPLDILDDSYISQEVWKTDSKIKYEERAIVYIKNPSNLKDWIKQKERNAYGEFALKKYKVSSMRSFKDELKIGFFKLLSYPQNIKEFFWTITLIFARFYVWAKAFIDIKFEKKTMKKMWVRVESTK